MRSDIAIIGAGPAGIAAAIEGAKAGAKVKILDENNSPGGQLFKQIHKFFGSRVHKAGVRGYDIGYDLLKEAEDLGVKVLLNSQVYALFNNLSIGFIKDGANHLLEASKIIIATGASENPLAFPGCTLPGVMGAGAAQTFINVHRILPGKKILMVGSGNVGLIVSYQLIQAGANVVSLIEAAPKIGGYGVHSAKIKRAGVPIMTGYTILKALGNERVERAVIAPIDENWKPLEGKEEILEVDTICLAVGLTPLIELAMMAGCQLTYIPALGGHLPLHNEDMETTVSGIYVAGDITGVEEASSAMEEGRLAGIACAQALGLFDEGEGNSKKTEVRERLRALRMGVFGEKRQISKDIILNRRRGLI